MSQLPDLLDPSGEAIKSGQDVSHWTKQEALTYLSYLLTANGQYKHEFRESAASSRAEEIANHPDPKTVDWSKQERIHVGGVDPETGLDWCLTYTPKKGAALFMPPQYLKHAYVEDVDGRVRPAKQDIRWSIRKLGETPAILKGMLAVAKSRGLRKKVRADDVDVESLEPFTPYKKEETADA